MRSSALPRPWHAPRLPLLLCAAVALALPAADAAAQWKWRDARGQITVSDLPPPREVPERDILQRPSAGAPPAAAPAPAAPAASGPAGLATVAQGAASAPVDPELEKRRQAAEKAAKDGEAARQREAEAKIAAQRAENCRAARSQLATLQSGQRVVRFNEKGEREFLDDAQRATESQRARAVIASDCR